MPVTDEPTEAARVFLEFLRLKASRKLAMLEARRTPHPVPKVEGSRREPLCSACQLPIARSERFGWHHLDAALNPCAVADSPKAPQDKGSRGRACPPYGPIRSDRDGHARR